MNTMHYYRPNAPNRHIGTPHMMILNNFKQIFNQENFIAKFCRAESQLLAAFVRLFGILSIFSILFLSNVFSLFANPNSNPDDSEVAIEVDVTAYTHWDGGLGCPGYNPAYGQSGDYVTLCFAITNRGNSALQNIQVIDTLSTKFATYPAVLWPGSTIRLSYQGILGESLPSQIAVQASTNPEMDLSPTFSGLDFIAVPIQQRSPSIELNQSVYLGHDGGAGCENSNNQLEAISGQELTFCFEIVNRGDTSLDTIQIVAPILSMNESHLLRHSGELPLAPNERLIYYHQTKAVGNLKVQARVQANPVDGNGNDLSELTNPYADSSVKISTPANTPGIMLVKTAYVNAVGEPNGPGADSVQATPNETIDYHLEIVNTGNTHLNSIQITDPNFNLNLSLNDPLAPNDSQRILIPDKIISADTLNTASVQANGIDENGSDLPGLANPVHQDSAFVDIIAPALTLEKSVYLGRDGGARCPGTTEITGGRNYDITYCYIVKNIGDVHLSDIEIEDKTVGIHLFIEDILAPNAQMIRYHEAKLDGAAVVPATVSANPVDQNGLDIAYISNPSARATAQARLSAGESGYSVRQGLYVGHDQGLSCPGSQGLVAGFTADVTYCIVITNNGSAPQPHSTLIADIGQIVELNMTKRSGADPLPPNASLIYYREGKQGDLADTQVFDADLSPQESGVGLVAAAEFLLETTGYQGQNGGTFCPGEQRIVGANSDRVTYCFKIKNQGNTYLDQINIASQGGTNILEPDELFLLRGTLPLAPGEEIIYYYHTDLEQDMVDRTTVTAQVTDAAGQVLPSLGSLTEISTIILERYVSIGDYIWYDTNANGLQDVGEEGAPDVNVTLHDATGSSVASVQTDANGMFKFDEISPDEYYLKVDPPAGYLFTHLDAAPSSDQEWRDSDVDPTTGRTLNFTMASGSGNLDLDAGLVAPASLGNRVWLDANGNGTQDDGETGVPNILIELYKANPSNPEGTPIKTTFTNQAGEFTFTNLQPNLYAIRVPLDATSGYGISPQNIGSSDELDSDINPQTGRSPDTQLLSGEEDQSWDVGLYSIPQITIGIDNNDLAATSNQSIIYTIDYANIGALAANNVLVTKELPTYTSFDASSSTEGWNCPTNENQCTYSLTNLSGQESQQLRFAVKTDAVLPSSAYLVKHELRISYRSPSMPTSIPDTIQSATNQIRFRPPPIVDLRDFSAHPTASDGILFNWELASENGVERFQIDYISDTINSEPQLISSISAVPSESEYNHVYPDGSSLIFSSLNITYWLTAFDAQDNGIRYGPFRLRGSDAENKLYLPLILQP